MKQALGPIATNRHLILKMQSPLMQRKTTCEKHDLTAVWKELINELAGH